MSVQRARAKEFLAHYLRVAFTRAGAKWDADNTAEVGELVDLLIDTAIEETIRKIEHSGLTFGKE